MNTKRMLAALVVATLAAGAFAHPHVVQTPGTLKKIAYTTTNAKNETVNVYGVVIANGQNHENYVNGVACGGSPAAYGLETAHHGPDSGTPGKADDSCYQIDGTSPGEDDRNPAIN